MIAAVQVGAVTGYVPPGSLKFFGTVVEIDVVISISGGEHHVTVG